ncbi:hypothetical protein [Streptomyces sp. NPDC088725]|uniref:hypothetical protein n=1 Tax=Streptomyces sp. NPDC088725 TaxID=3365873 RepID=UPI0038205A29
MIAVLVPVLTGAAAVIYLLVGHLLKALGSPPAFAVGRFSGAVTVIDLPAAAVGPLIAALRNASTHLRTEAPDEEPPAELAVAREAWRDALLACGIEPFLRTAAPGPDVPPPPGCPATPTIGYSRPDFSSPADGSAPGAAGATADRASPAPATAAPNTGPSKRTSRRDALSGRRGSGGSVVRSVRERQVHAVPARRELL